MISTRDHYAFFCCACGSQMPSQLPTHLSFEKENRSIPLIPLL
jgi:hypothetical protein